MPIFFKKMAACTGIRTRVACREKGIFKYQRLNFTDFCEFVKPGKPQFKIQCVQKNKKKANKKRQDKEMNMFLKEMKNDLDE